MSEEDENSIHTEKYIQCPCGNWVELIKPGKIERCVCSKCDFNFCSICKQMFHGLSTNTNEFKDNPNNNIKIDDRLTCGGAAKISKRWSDWKESYDEDLLTSRVKQIKHHIALPPSPPTNSLLSRSFSSEYRLNCSICNNDIIGPRFSCIHCPNGLECCMNCSKDSETLKKIHNQNHVFQIFLEDENPILDPNLKEKCSICLSDDYDSMIKLDSCSHSAHLDCLKGQLSAGWAGKNISFNFMTCPECRIPIMHPDLFTEIEEHKLFKTKVENLVLEKCKEDGLIENLDKLIIANEIEAKTLCFNTMSCFMCNGCDEPYCGGRVDCAEDLSLDMTTMRCAKCIFNNNSTSSWQGKCATHGYKFAVYKCDSCCSVATWDCRSNHYCGRCHDIAWRPKNFPCLGLGKCPLGIPHPANRTGIHGEIDNGFIIGCIRCFSGSEELVLQTDDSAIDAAQEWERRFVEKENGENIPLEPNDEEYEEENGEGGDEDEQDWGGDIVLLRDPSDDGAEYVPKDVIMNEEWKSNVDKIASNDPDEHLLGIYYLLLTISISFILTSL
jgi:hypothetical protein